MSWDKSQPSKHDISYRAKNGGRPLEEGLNAQCIYVNIESLKKTKLVFRDIFRFSGKTKFGFLPKCKIIWFFINLIKVFVKKAKFFLI